MADPGNGVATTFHTWAMPEAAPFLSGNQSPQGGSASWALSYQTSCQRIKRVRQGAGAALPTPAQNDVGDLYMFRA
jgi:hypothetical protein